MSIARAAAALLLALAGAWSMPAAAHNRGASYSTWTLDPTGADVQVRVSQLELTRLALDPRITPDYLAQVGKVLAASVQLWSAGGRCIPGKPSATDSGDGWVVAHWSLACASAQNLAVRSNLFLDVAPSHLHFASVSYADGRIAERVLTYAQPALILDERPALPASLGRYVALGVDHILSGWDHLAFILALILLAIRLRDVALVATGFTVAHSVTLAAAVLGVAQVQASVVETLIGFSIALVAAENLWLRGGRDATLPIVLAAALAALALTGATHLPLAVLLGLALFVACYFALLRDAGQPLRWRVAIAFLFGLVHGFGFAGALTPLQLPPSHLAVALAGFNGGVEIGQLLVIGAAWPLLRLLDRAPPLRTWGRDAVSASVVAVGTFWFVLRALA